MREADRIANATAVVQSLYRMCSDLGLELTLRFSHVTLIPACLDPLDLQGFKRRRIIGALEKERSIEKVSEILEICEIPRSTARVLRGLAERRRSPLAEASAFLQSSSPVFSAAAADIGGLAESLDRVGMAERCLFDPGIYRSLDFYDAVTMQGDLPGMEECLGGGDFT